MGGGLMQLVAYGAQDIYLTGNPQITFFKVVYRRHTNFSMEAIKQTFSGSTGFGNDVTATISRNGDLVYRMYLEHDAIFQTATDGANNDVGLVEHYGHSLIKECEIEIGGQKIDKHTSMWNRVWSDLTEFNPTGHFGSTVPANNAANGNTIVSGNGTLYQLMTGNSYGLNTEVYTASTNEFSGQTGDDATAETINGFDYLTQASGGGQINVNKIFLPLNFWFNRNPGLALPLIALQYHEVKVKMTFESLGNLSRHTATDGFDTDVVVGTSSILNVTPNFDLWCDYIYLDTDERRRFAQVSHEYLIEQLQISDNTITSTSPTIDLNFNHPVKELIWCTRNESGGDGSGRCQTLATTPAGDPTAGPVSLERIGGNWQLKLNGHDRFKERDTQYFTKTQVWQHHTGYGGTPTFGAALLAFAADDILRAGDDSIAVYSFALKPEEHQPSGTCNFSRIDNAQLVGRAIQTPIAGGTMTNVGTPTTADTVKLTIFAVNYNVLRIMSGMGGLAYSN
jgi:hypothetical protein